MNTRTSVNTKTVDRMVESGASPAGDGANTWGPPSPRAEQTSAHTSTPTTSETSGAECTQELRINIAASVPCSSKRWASEVTACSRTVYMCSLTNSRRGLGEHCSGAAYLKFPLPRLAKPGRHFLTFCFVKPASGSTPGRHTAGHIGTL